MTLSSERIKGIVNLYNNNFLFKNDDNALILENTKDSIIQLFTQYACADFALAINTLTGWDSYEFYNEEDESYSYHVVSKHPNKDLFFDINGFLTEEDISKLYFDNKEISSYNVGLTSCALQLKDERNRLMNLIDSLVHNWSDDFKRTIR